MPLRQNRYWSGREPRPLRRQPSKNPLPASSWPRLSATQGSPREAARRHPAAASPAPDAERRATSTTAAERSQAPGTTAPHSVPMQDDEAPSPGTPSCTSHTSDPFAVPPFPANCQNLTCLTLGVQSSMARDTNYARRRRFGIGPSGGRHNRNPTFHGMYPGRIPLADAEISLPCSAVERVAG